MLSCSCLDPEDCDWYFFVPGDFTKLETKRRKRCCSCRKLIDIGAECLELERVRPTNTDIEERIYGEEISLASWYMCRWCGEMFLTFSEHGFCPNPADNMFENLKDYWEMNGYTPEKYRKKGDV